MIIDSQQIFSDAQALTATAVSTNVIDLGADRNIGIGEPMAVVINVDVAADSTTGDETYEFQVQTGSTATPTTVIGKIGYGGSNELAESTLAAGYRIVIPLPTNSTADRYLRLNYVLGGTTPTITVTSHLQPLNMIQAEVTYPKGYTIS